MCPTLVWRKTTPVAAGLLLASCVVAPALDSGLEDASVEMEVDAGRADAGPPDPGFDIPPGEWVDAGQGGAWGCFGRQLDRFIAQFETRDNSSPWCASVLFKRQDGGFTPLFPDFDGPQDFEIADARWAPGCSGLELPDGGLNPMYRPVHSFSGQLRFRALLMNRPRAYDIDAGMRIAYRVVWFNQGASLSANCPGP